MTKAIGGKPGYIAQDSETEIKYFVAENNDTLASISKKTGISEDILEYLNPTLGDGALSENTAVQLTPKGKTLSEVRNMQSVDELLTDEEKAARKKALGNNLFKLEDKISDNISKVSSQLARANLLKANKDYAESEFEVGNNSASRKLENSLVKISDALEKSKRSLETQLASNKTTNSSIAIHERLKLDDSAEGKANDSLASYAETVKRLRSKLKKANTDYENKIKLLKW